ncbi:DUF930 domain-containing protein [Pararhizobium antarcticum]|uniref:DUF930 domain-containing protein n=1 Tax=Pararhizobium antarcticum TaxID=1798805 RepID=A0A657LRG4_9HYPH|nr:DUF930 domain-containing protein [Pararhizobium antarcticum]OJF94246.1 hypothetical protein AX761_18820 [Rhizobium sp. 58]OJF96272.1 hypothetical protein AX760_17885 [Pararhizobium antarcticum]
MRIRIWPILAVVFTATSTSAMDQRLVRQFEKLDPETRLEQRCDTEAMERISADKSVYRPDKVIAYTFADPVMEENAMKAPGAVFRSKGEWYRLTFKCSTGPEHLKVLSFKYKIGEVVPHDEWEKHYLYP